MDRLLRILNTTKVVREKLPQIIDAFVGVYGESYREIITERLSSANIFGYYNIETLKALIKKEQVELSRFYLENVSFEYGGYIDDIFVNLVGDNLSNYNDALLNTVVKCINRVKEDDYSDSTLQIIISQVNKTSKNINEDNAVEMIKSGELDYLISIHKEILKQIEEYKKAEKEKLGSFIEFRDRFVEYHDKLNSKYMLEVIKQYDKYLTDEDKVKFNKMLEKGEYTPFSMPGGYKIFGSKLQGDNVISAFTKDAEEKINNPDIHDFLKEDLYSKRIKYFKYRGIDLGNNYEAYKDDPRCKEVWITDADEIIKMMEEKDLMIDRQIYATMDSCVEADRIAKEKCLLDKEDTLSPDIVRNGLTCIMPNFYEKNGNYVLSPVVAIGAQDTEYMDQYIMHELNHIIELSHIDVNGNNYTALCGWDITTGSINQDSSIPTFLEEPDRDYEQFNEILNELIAQRATKRLHEKGIYLLCDSEHAKIAGGTNYEKSKKYVYDFLISFFPEIIKSRVTGNMQIIFDKVGKEKFDALNNVVKDFFVAFPNTSFITLYEALADYRDGKDSEGARKLIELEERAKSVYMDMRSFNYDNAPQTL